MKVSIFTNINGHVEFFFSVTDDRRRGFRGVFVVPGFQLFFTANLGGWVSSEYPSIVGLKDILIHPCVLFYVLSNFSQPNTALR